MFKRIIEQLPLSGAMLVKFILTTWFVIEMIVALAILLSSCNTVRKTLTKSKEKTDSVSIVKTDSTAIKKSDSTGSKVETGMYERKITYFYDTITKVYKTIIHEKGTYRTEEAARKTDYDSTAKKASSETELKKDTLEVDKAKESKRFLVLGFVISVIVTAAGVLAYMRMSKRLERLSLMIK
ncbi:MAG TPA: hypothetical protein VF610_13490 [Segetibacter sp.]|jgi:uncharacterized protein YceK